MVTSATASKMLGLFPASPVTSMTTHAYTVSQSSTVPATASGPWSITSFSDSDVFAHQIVHSQLDGSGAPDAARSWELRIGKGGQIYSLSTQGLETQPPQYRPANIAANPVLNGTDPNIVGGRDWAPWVDDVLQMVTANGYLNTRLPDPSTGVLVGPWKIHNTVSEHSLDATQWRHQPADYKYFMHGSGAYLRDYQTTPVYNPVLAAQANTTETSYSSMHWMVQAHSPAIFPGHCINYYRYRDIGGGFIEVTAVIYNFKYAAPVFDQSASTAYPGALNSFNFPIGGVRETTYGKFYLPDPATGALVEQTGRQTFSDRADPTPFDAFGGWLCFSAGSAQGNRALAVVTGGHRTVDGYNAASSDLRWGYVDTTAPVAPGGVTTTRNYQLASFVRIRLLNPGEGMWARWYVGVGSRADLKAAIDSAGLAATHASFGITAFAEATTPVIGWYGANTGPLTDQPGASPPRFYTYAWPVTGSVPLFQVKDATGTYKLTIDPYHFNGTATEQHFGLRQYRSYDGGTAEIVCLGFVMPTVAATNAGGGVFPYAALTACVNAGFVVAPDPDLAFTLQVRTSFRIQNSGAGSWVFSPNSAPVGPSLAGTTSSGPNTRWQLVPAGAAGQFRIENVATGRWLAAASASTVNEAAPTGPAASALWTLSTAANGDVQITNVTYGTVLAAVAASMSLQLVTAGTSGLLPLWKLIPVT